MPLFLFVFEDTVSSKFGGVGVWVNFSFIFYVCFSCVLGVGCTGCPYFFSLYVCVWYYYDMIVSRFGINCSRL